MAARRIWPARRRTTAACRRKNGPLVLAYGRDPYFDGWPDTLQLNYGNPELQQAMIGELERIAGQCDGVRCDMAMLVLPEVFERTWGIPAQPFWPTATQRVRDRVPGFCFMAEVYWDLEWELQQQGFDYTYDKRLYDRLREGHARPVREHFRADLDFQNNSARFLENHDEPRAAATFPPEVHEAAAVITFLSPGLRFFHQGQFEGRTKRISPHLVRGSGGAGRPAAGTVLRPAAGRAASIRRARWLLAIARMQAGLGRQLDFRLLRGLFLDRTGWRESAWSSSTTRITKASATLQFPGLNLKDRCGNCVIEWERLFLNETALTWPHEVCIWTCRPGPITFLTCT